MKLVQNCEALLFQRPDDAVHRGFDHQAEADIAAEVNHRNTWLAEVAARLHRRLPADRPVLSPVGTRTP